MPEGGLIRVTTCCTSLAYTPFGSGMLNSAHALAVLTIKSGSPVSLERLASSGAVELLVIHSEAVRDICTHQGEVMRTQSSDTHPEAERVQLELLRRAGADRRAAMACGLSSSTRALSLGNLERLHPELTPRQRLVKLAEAIYGEELVAKARGAE